MPTETAEENQLLSSAVAPWQHDPMELISVLMSSQTRWVETSHHHDSLTAPSNKHKHYRYYLHQGGYVFARLSLSVCLCVSKITRKVINGSF